MKNNYNNLSIDEFRFERNKNNFQKIRSSLSFKNMLQVILILFAFLIGHKSFGQVSNYTFSQSAGTYTALSTSTVIHASGWDDNVASVTIPFTFTFNGTGYTSCSVNSNGYITFGTTASAVTDYNPISAGNAYSGAISALGRDLTSNSSTIVYGVTGASPNRVFVIQWNNARRYYNNNARNGNFNFQIRLSETTNLVQVVYGATGTNYNTDIPVEVGLRGATNTDYNNRTLVSNWAASTAGGSNAATCNTGSGANELPANGQTYTWTPPFACSGLPAASTTVSSINPACSGTNFTLSLGTTYSGSGITYQWESANDISFTTGLTSLGTSSTQTTSQTSNKYYRARITCSGNTTISTPLLVSTTLCYCASTSTNNNEYISRVVSGGFTNTTTQSNYADYTGLGSIASVMQGTATSTIRVTTSSGHNNDGIYLFADWNQDGDFADGGEVVAGPTAAAGSGTYSLTITVPAGATIGTTRLRIKLARNANNNPCQATFNNGEVEDYLITVIPTCTLTVTATSGQHCGPGTVTLTAVGGSGTTQYRWYEYISSGSPVATTTTGSFVTPSLTTTKTYYVTAYNGICESPRFPVNAFIYSSPASSVTPAAANLCDGVIELVATGSNSGTTDTLFYEDFEVSTSTLMMLQDYGSSAFGYWYIEESPSEYISYETVSSGSNFAAIDSNYDFPGYSNNALTMSGAISTYNYTSLALTFRHYYNYFNYNAPDQAIVEVNTDGDLDGVWTAIQTYTSDQGTLTNFALVNIDLSAYINQPNLRVRFRYYSGWNYGWNIDDIRITGTSVPSPVAWTPVTGLYTDAALTTPYTGGNSATVYAYPDTAQTYTATVTNGSGCHATDTSIISGNSNIWNGTSWSTGTSPITGTEKIIFNGNYSSTGDLSGCLLQVNSGNVVINADNTITITNQVRIKPAATFTLEDTASLLQTAGTANTNIGIIKAKRNTQPIKRLDFTYWSSPVAGQTLHNLSPTTLADKYYSWNPVSQAWVTHMNGNTTMLDAKGYIVRAPQSFSTTAAIPYIATFEGIPNNADISIPVYGNTSILPADYKWNLIGNPYPSALDIDEFLSHPDNIAAVDGTIYLWTHNSAPSNAIPGDQTYNYTANDYATYNLSGGVATSPATPDPLHPEISNNFNTTTPTKYLASGQAFFVRGLGNVPVRFINDMRVQDENNQFFRNPNPCGNTTHSGIEKNRFWLNIRNNQGAFNQALIGYIEGATNGLDRGFDGNLFGGNYVSIYSLNNAQKLTIQGRALPFDEADSVDLGIKATIAGTFTISLDMLDGLFVTQDIYLKDNLLNVIHDLKSGPYSFTSNIGTFDSRFKIVYENDALGVPEFNAESIIIYKKDKSVVVNAGLAIIGEVKVFDIQGRLLFDGQKINATETIIKSLPPTEQVLIVQVVTAEGAKVAKKIIY